MKAVVILAHQMDADGVLNAESRARIGAALELDKRHVCDYFITSGWNYRPDTALKIGNVVAETLVNECSINKERVLADTNARDTVGDAFFLRRNIIFPKEIKEIFVVTSEYHVKRTDIIFKRFFLPYVKVTTIGAHLNMHDNANLIAHEEASLAAFSKTFEGVNFARDDEAFAALAVKHPFYNGVVYGKIERE